MGGEKKGISLTFLCQQFLMQWLSPPWSQLSLPSAPLSMVPASMGQSSTRDSAPTECPQFLAVPHLPNTPTLKVVAASCQVLTSGWPLDPCLFSLHPLTNYPCYITYFGKNSDYFCFTDWTLTDTILYILPHQYFCLKAFIMETAITYFSCSTISPRNKMLPLK